MNRLNIVLIACVLSACSGSNGNTGDGGNTAGSDGQTNESSDMADEGSSTANNTDLAAHDTDVYDPNNNVSNACSSLLWDAVAGTYNGTVEAYGLTGGPTCTWDVGVTMKRVYEPDTNRNKCNLETTYSSSLISETNFELNSSSQCEDVNTSGIVTTSFLEDQLSNPDWPVSLLLNLDYEPGEIYRVIPLDNAAYRADQMKISTWINVDSSGAMSERSPTVPSDGESTIRTWNMQRVSRDAAP